jgi:hypothetical protein
LFDFFPTKILPNLTFWRFIFTKVFPGVTFWNFLEPSCHCHILWLTLFSEMHALWAFCDVGRCMQLTSSFPKLWCEHFLCVNVPWKMAANRSLNVFFTKQNFYGKHVFECKYCLSTGHEMAWPVLNCSLTRSSEHCKLMLLVKSCLTKVWKVFDRDVGYD